MLYKVSKKYLKVYFIFLNFVFLEKIFIVSDLTQSGVLSGQIPQQQFKRSNFPLWG